MFFLCIAILRELDGETLKTSTTSALAPKGIILKLI